MPDVVGLDADLVLTIDRALADISTLEAALAAATTGVAVTLDTTSVLTDLQAAIIDASSSPVMVSADTTEIPTTIAEAVAAVVLPPVPVDANTTDAEQMILALGDQPPVDVPVTADTATAEQMILDLGNAPPVEVPVDANTVPAEATIAALGASISPIDVPVEADTSQAQADIEQLGSSASSAAGGVDSLSGSITGIGVAAGISEGSANELVKTVGELGGPEGTAAAGGILALSATTAGFFTEGMNAVSAGQRFDMVLGDMGNKIKQIDVNGLNTDMAHLGIQFGSTSAEMENVNSKLFQNAINAGISKDKAVQFTQQIETLSARAISLNPTLGTLSDVSSSLGDKLARGGRFAQNYQIQLTAAEISTRALADTGKTTASELTVIEKSIAGAELASEKYGSTLAGTVAEGSKNAAVQMESLKASFKEAIEQIGIPLVAPILDLIKQAEPDAIIVAEVLGRLGKDVLPIVSDALAVLGPVLTVVENVLSVIPDQVITTVAAFALFGPAVGAVVAAMEVYNAVFGAAAPYADDVTRAVDTAAKGFDDLTVSVKDNVAAEIDAAVKTGDFAKRIDDASVSSSDLTQALLAGGDQFAIYAARIMQAAAAHGAGFDSAVKLSNELQHLQDQTEASAAATLDKAVADGKLTAAERDQAEANAGQIDGQTNYAKALDIVQPKLAAAQKAIDDKTAADKAAKDAADAHAAAMKEIGTAAEPVALHLAQVQATTGDWGNALAGLAESLDEAKLKSKNFDAVAQELGVTSEQLKGFVGDVTKEIQGFVDTAMKGLPNVSSAIDDVLNPKKKEKKAIIIDPAQLQQEIDDDIAKIDAFNQNLAFLTMHGLNNLAQIAAQKGPEFTAALVTSIQSGGPDVGTSLDSKFAELNQKTRDEGPILREAGTGIAVATGDVARDAATQFGDKFQLNPAVQTETANVTGEIDGWAHNLPSHTQAAAEAGGLGWLHSFNLRALAATELANTNAEIDGWAHTLGPTAQSTGDTTKTGFTTGLTPVGEEARGMFMHVADVVSEAQKPISAAAAGAGHSVGAEFAIGMGKGIDDYVSSVEVAARDAVIKAEKAAHAQADAHSPSKVFAAIGGDLATGLAQGIGAQTPAAAKAAASLVAQAAAAAAAVASAHEHIHDVMYQVGDLDAGTYLAYLNQRMQREEEAGHKYEQTWKAAYDTAQQVQAAIDKAKLDQPFQNLADTLGVSVTKIHDFATKMRAAIDNVAQSAQSSLPTLSSILSKSLDPAGLLDTKAFETNVQDQIKQVQEYTANVDKLMAAGLSHTAQLAIEQGPAAAAALAASGSTTLEASLVKFDDVSASVVNKAKNEWGPKLVDQLGETAKLAGTEFGTSFSDTFIASLTDNASTIRQTLNGILGIPLPPVAPQDQLNTAVQTMAAPGVNVALAAVMSRPPQTPSVVLNFHERALNFTAPGGVTDANAAQMGTTFARTLADELKGHLAGVS